MSIVKPIRMRSKIWITVLLAVMTFFSAKAATMVLAGTYQLRNLYVVNATSSAGVGGCITQITVNGDVAPDEITDDAFEIDLSLYGLKLGDSVVVKITYKDGCKPRILNPGALKPDPTFNVVNIQMIGEDKISWTTVNEQGALPFIVQQKKWNKWVDVGEVMGIGTSDSHKYEFAVVPISGDNEFRVIQKSYDGTTRKSQVVKFTSTKAPVTYAYNSKKETLEFSDNTGFELYDAYGQIVKKGFAKEVDLSDLRKDTYIVSYDNTVAEFNKK